MIFVTLSWCALGQSNYKTLYESLKHMKDYEAFKALFAYQSATSSKNFVNLNGYYQMGLIAQKMMRDYDPFIQSSNVAQCISDAETYLALALHYFNEKEAKSNGRYYQGTPGGELTYASIKKNMEDRLSDVKEFNLHFLQNLSYLNKCTRIYNACIETFGEINRQNSRLNDLYFLADDALKRNFDLLQSNFDSTLYYTDRLKESLEAYPMSKYKISYSLAPVEVYRLHGIVSANFIAEKVVIWDFRSWVDAYRKTLDSDVAFLYAEAEKIDKTHAKYIADMKRGDNAAGVPEGYFVNPVVVGKILKYDFNSAVAPLLKYQEDKVNFLYLKVNNTIDKSLYAANNFARSNSYYFELAANKRTLDSALIRVESKITTDAIKKYQAFFDKNYGGRDGVDKYLRNESKDNDYLLREALNQYKNNVWKSMNIDSAARTKIMYKDESLFDEPVSPERVDGAGYFIHSKAVMPNKKAFVAGSYANAHAEIVPFIALINDGTVEWLKTLDKKDGSKHFGVLAATMDNGFAVVTRVAGEKETANYIYLFDKAGTVKNNQKISANSTPRKILYDDISETFLLAFKGESFAACSPSDDELQLCLLKSDLSIAWERKLAFTGYLANIIKTNDRFYVYGAYSKLTDDRGKVFQTANGKINAFAYPVNSSGEWIAMKTFDADFSYFPLHVSKIGNEYVDMICVKNSAESSSAVTTNDEYYMIISSENKLYFAF